MVCLPVPLALLLDDTELTKLKAQHLDGPLATTQKWRLGTYLDYWLEEVVKPNRRPNTYAQCETIARLYLKPHLGRFYLEHLTTPTVQTYLNSAINRGLTLPRAQVIKKVLSAALTRALREELVTRNVARLVELPTYEPVEVQPWSLTEAKAFLNAASESRYAAAYFLLLFYGLRRGEVLGLRWQDVDVQGGILRIRQQLLRVGRQLLIGPLKTRAGKRDLPLLPAVAAVLAKHREQNITSPDHDLIFTTSRGTPTEPRNFVRDYDNIIRANQLRRIKVHGLRHTTATLLKDGGVPDRDIQLILGHARITTTQEIYQHVDMTSRREAAAIMEHAFAPDTQTKSSQPVQDGSLKFMFDGNDCRQNSRQPQSFMTRYFGLPLEPRSGFEPETSSLPWKRSTD